MSTTFTFQTVAIIVAQNSSMPEDIIKADSGIQSAQAASANTDMLVSYQEYYNQAKGNDNPDWAYCLTFIVSAATALNIIAGKAALLSRLQSLAPQVIDVQTWGVVTVVN
jgi:hypothetical protein